MKKTFTKSVIAVSSGCLDSQFMHRLFRPHQLSSQLEQASYRHKFVNELIFILISPAYAVCSVADLFVLELHRVLDRRELRIAEAGTHQGRDG